jgi:hypothetical protein
MLLFIIQESYGVGDGDWPPCPCGSGSGVVVPVGGVAEPCLDHDSPLRGHVLYPTLVEQ